MGQRDVDAQRDGGCPREQIVGLEGAGKGPAGIAVLAVGQRTGCATLTWCVVLPFVVCA